MTSPSHPLPNPDISDVTKVSSRKRNEPEDEDKTEEYNDEQSNTNKRARVSVSIITSVLVPESSPASFNTLDDDCLGNVLDFVGKKCYSTFGRVNKRCHEMFCSKGLTKETYLYGYGPLNLVQQRGKWNFSGLSNAVLHYNRRDVFDCMLTDENEFSGYWNLKHLCEDATKESRLDILREVFDRANERQLEILRKCDYGFDLCAKAAEYGNLECLNWLRENECGWNEKTWERAVVSSQYHILEYLRNNGYPTEWRVEIESKFECESDSEDNSDY